MRRAGGTGLLGLGLLLAAAAFDAEALRVPGLMLAALPVAAVAWVALGSSGLRADREIGATRVVEGEVLHVRLRLRTGRIPPPGGVLLDDVLPEPLPLGPARRPPRARVRVTYARRGRRRLAPPRIVVADPLGLAERRLDGRGDEAEVLVLPRLEPVRVSGSGEEAGSRRGRPRTGAEAELDGVRQLRDGTSASRIYWPALARGGTLMERRLRAEGDRRPVVVLDARAPACDEDLDAAVRAAASLCVHLARRGGCAVLLPGDRRPTVVEAGLAGWPRLHARLALVEAGGGPAPGALGPRSGAVLYVAARVPGAAPRALGHAPAGGRLLVVPGSLPGRRPLFEVAGCRGYLPAARRPGGARAPAAAGAR